MKEATEIYDLIKIKYVNPARQLILKNKYSEAKKNSKRRIRKIFISHYLTIVGHYM
ncbi:MAG: hypothetical protein ACTSRG_14945 [Candidatus Helarchaeota archaeon]